MHTSLAFVLAERNLRQQEQTVSIKRFGEDLITLQQVGDVHLSAYCMLAASLLLKDRFILFP